MKDKDNPDYPNEDLFWWYNYRKYLEISLTNDQVTIVIISA